MNIAHVLLLCALALTVLGTFSPLMSLLKIKKSRAIGWMCGVLICMLIEYRLAAIVVMLPAIIWVLGMRWWGGACRSIAGMLVGGFVAVILLWLDFTPEAGVLAGGVAAAACGVVSRYRRVWLSAGYACVPFAWLVMLYVYNNSGALLYVEPRLWLDATVTCALCSTLFCGAFEAMRHRRRFAAAQ